LCGNNRHLGVAVDGGFATHVLVPHQRYLLDYTPLPANFAGPLMCSGLTAYGALKRHTIRPERGPVLPIGLGGVGVIGNQRSTAAPTCANVVVPEVFLSRPRHCSHRGRFFQPEISPHPALRSRRLNGALLRCHLNSSPFPSSLRSRRPPPIGRIV
jgi:hypothetical protein